MIETVSELSRKINAVAKEVGCDGKKIASHNIRSHVVVYCEEIDKYFKITSIEPTLLPGCLCWDGVQIELEEEED